MTFIPQAPVPYVGANRAVDLGAQNLTSTGLATFGNLDVDTLNLNGNVITDSTGTISFNDDHLQTTGNIHSKADAAKHYFGAGDEAYCEYSASSSWDFYPGASNSMTVNRGSFDATTLRNASFGLRVGFRRTTNATVIGGWSAGQYDGTVTNTNSAIGFNPVAYSTNTGNMTRTALPGLIGTLIESQQTSTGTITEGAGAVFRGRMTAAGTFTQYDDIRIKDFDKQAGTLTTLAGIRLDALTAGGTNYGINDAGNNWIQGAAGKHYFRDTAIGIYSQADTFLDIFADGAVRIGNSSAGAPTTYMGIEPDGGVVFVGTGAGLAFADIYATDASDTITFALTGKVNKEQITSFTANGVSNNMTPDHSSDHITVVKAGMYLCKVSIHAVSVGAGGADNYGYSVFKNGGTVEFSNLHGQRDLAGGGGDEGSMTLSGIIDLAVSDTIEVWVWNNTNDDSIVIDDINLALVQIGGT